MCGSCLVRGEEVVGFEAESLGGYGFIRLMDEFYYILFLNEVSLSGRDQNRITIGFAAYIQRARFKDGKSCFVLAQCWKSY